MKTISFFNDSLKTYISLNFRGYILKTFIKKINEIIDTGQKYVFDEIEDKTKIELKIKEHNHFLCKINQMIYIFDLHLEDKNFLTSDRTFFFYNNIKNLRNISKSKDFILYILNMMNNSIPSIFSNFMYNLCLIKYDDFKNAVIKSLNYDWRILNCKLDCNNKNFIRVGKTKIFKKTSSNCNFCIEYMDAISSMENEKTKEWDLFFYSLFENN